MNRVIPIIVLLLLLIVFTFTFGVAYFPTLDADNAVQVIMIDHLSFPSDLYYMGQDRIGSIVPGLGWIFYQFGATPIWAVTLTQVLIYLISGLILIRLFKNPLVACLALIIMLFPLSEYESQVLSGHPYLGHVLVLMLSIWAFKKYGLERPIWLLFIGIGMWASGIFAANIAAAGLIYLASGHLKLKDKKYWQWVLKSSLWALPGLALLILAKKTATTTDNNYTHSSFVNGEQLLANISTFFSDLWHFISFEHPDPWLSLAFWFLLLILAVSAPVIKRNGFVSWSSFFLLSGLITILAIILSEWAFKMGLPRRYFSIAYIQVIWGLMLAWDNAETFRFRKYGIALLIASAILTACSGLMSKGQFWREVPDRLYANSARKLAAAIKTEGILGSYWYVYLTEAFDPENITSVVEQNGINRDFAAMKRFVALDTITIIKNSYLAELTDTVVDHGTVFIKSGPTQKVDNVEFAEYYKPSPFKDFYLFSDLNINYGDIDTNKAGETVIRFTPENFTGNNFAAFGPYLSLPSGDYQVCFNLVARGDIGPEAFVDVYRRRHPVKRIQLLENKENPCFNFTLDEPAVHVEMRVGYFGRGEIEFKKIGLKKISQ